MKSKRYYKAIAEALSANKAGFKVGSRILITGATGLIGSCLADMVACISRDESLGLNLVLSGRSLDSLAKRFESDDERISFLRWDVLGDENCFRGEKYDYIFHCASNAHPALYASQPVETAWANLNGTRHLLEKLHEQGNGRLILISSSEVYGSLPGDDPFREEESGFVDSLSARACYPSSKRMAETLCACYAAEYGIDFVVARPGHIYGPTQTKTDSRAHAQFARLAAQGENIVLKSSGEQPRSYVNTIDCGTALICMAALGQSGAAYNIALPGTATTIRQLAESFARAGGSKVTFDLPDEFGASGYTPMMRSCLDSSRLLGLGWRPIFDVGKGTKMTVEVLREEMERSALCE